MKSISDQQKDGDRNVAIDALRGLVMIIMLLDHTRERFFLQYPVRDPVDWASTNMDLFSIRLLSSLCAPVFIVLAGLSAWYVTQKQGQRASSWYLFKRGIVLVLLELTFVGIPWYDKLPPQTIWLQVIWAIGISMIMLAGLLHLPRKVLLWLALIILCGHNLLDRITFSSDSAWFIPWALLHERSVIELGTGMLVKTTYPVLPWIGVIVFGYWMGPWFTNVLKQKEQCKKLLLLGVFMLGSFILIRGLNVYGDKPWVIGENMTRTLMSFLSLTKYPPSLLYLMLTLGVGFVMLSWLVQCAHSPWLVRLARFGSAPMFFYLLHLYTLKALSLLWISKYGTNFQNLYVVESVAQVLGLFVLTLVILYYPVCKFAAYKQGAKSAWLKYF